MLEIILARHGETDWNVAEVFRGRLDVELNETGVKQAELLGEYLSAVKIDAIYSSPLKRSYVTAEMIAASHAHAIVEVVSFNEIDHGFWEGLTLEEVKREYGDLYAAWLTSPHQVRMPQGETLDEVRSRAVGSLNEIVSKHKDSETILIVAHDAINKILLLNALGLDNSHFWQIKQGNASIDIMEYKDGKFTITLINDTCHLGGIIDETTVGAL